MTWAPSTNQCSNSTCTRLKSHLLSWRKTILRELRVFLTVALENSPSGETGEQNWRRKLWKLWKEKVHFVIFAVIQVYESFACLRYSVNVEFDIYVCVGEKLWIFLYVQNCNNYATPHKRCALCVNSLKKSHFLRVFKERIVENSRFFNKNTQKILFSDYFRLIDHTEYIHTPTHIHMHIHIDIHIDTYTLTHTVDNFKQRGVKNINTISCLVEQKTSSKNPQNKTTNIAESAETIHTQLGNLSLKSQANEKQLSRALKKNESETLNTQLTAMKRELSEINEKQFCAVCRESQKNMVLGCGHTFCRECIETAERGTNKCPTCRQRIVYKRSLYY